MVDRIMVPRRFLIHIRFAHDRCVVRIMRCQLSHRVPRSISGEGG